MKLHILSDLHIEFTPYELADTDADVVVLAGDIHLGVKGFQWAKETIKINVVWHRRSLKWLQKEIGECGGEAIVVVTHHAPCIDSIPPEDRNDPLSASYASDLNDFVASSGIDVWIHGHIHAARDYSIGGTRVICNPRGYPDEPAEGFDPSLTVDV